MKLKIGGERDGGHTKSEQKGNGAQCNELKGDLILINKTN